MDFVKFQMNNNGWTSKYIDSVIEEFDKFMDLKVIDNNIVAPNYIDKVWFQIILDTKLYYKYCIDKYDTLIHRHPDNIVNPVHGTEYELNKKLINLYVKTYNKLPDFDIWSLQTCTVCNDVSGLFNFKTFECCNKNDVCIKCFEKITTCIHCNNKASNNEACNSNAYNSEEPDDEEANDIEIFIKTPIYTTSINISNMKTIHDLKLLIVEKIGIPFDQMRLIFDGRQMDNTDTINGQNIKNQNTVYLVLPLRGC